MGGWERVKQSKMSEGWEGGLKKEKSEKGTKGGAFESALIKARVMDRTCGRACLAFCGVCVRAWVSVRGDGVVVGGAKTPSRDVCCQWPEWDKNLKRNFKATSVRSTPLF